jgi:hypothetical protein
LLAPRSYPAAIQLWSMSDASIWWPIIFGSGPSLHRYSSHAETVSWPHLLDVEVKNNRPKTEMVLGHIVITRMPDRLVIPGHDLLRDRSLIQDLAPMALLLVGLLVGHQLIYRITICLKMLSASVINF